MYISTILRDLHACSIDLTSGVPTPLTGSPITSSSSLVAIAVDSSQKFVFVARDDDHLDTYPIDADGNLPVTASSSIALAARPMSLTLEPSGRFAYVASDLGNAIYTFSVDAATGELSAVGTGVKVGSDPAFASPSFVAADPTGHFVYVSMFDQPGVRGYRIDQTSGTLSELAGSPFALSGLPAGDQVVSGPIVFKATGDFLFTGGGNTPPPDGGVFTSGALNAFAIDKDSGQLTLVNGSPFSTDLRSDGNAPNLAIDPQGRYLYAVNFLGDGHGAGTHLSGFAIDPNSGALTPVAGSPLDVAAPYSVAVDASGRFVFVGVDDFAKLAVFGVTRDTGQLTELDDSPFPFGGFEQKFAFAVRP